MLGAHEAAVQELLGVEGLTEMHRKTLELLASEHEGLVKADAKHKQKVFRLTRAVVDNVDKNGRLRYELERLEEALLEIYKHPEHAQSIVHRTIPKKVFIFNQDPGKKPDKQRHSMREEAQA